MAVNARPARPLTARPLDLVYVVWFALHLVIMFNVDMVSIYNRSLTPAFQLNLRQWYIDTYHDRFFTEPPAWFLSFMWMEALYHVPLSLWAIPALIRDDPLVPVHLLIWSVQTFVTTLVCIVEYFAWEGVTNDELFGLSTLYGPYCALAAFMGIEVFLRLKQTLTAKPTAKKTQ